MPTLNYSSNVLAFADAETSSNPMQRYADWSRNVIVSVDNPRQLQYTLEPGESIDIFDGSRSTSIDTDTEFLLEISSLSSSRYRFTWTETGTDPEFRTDRQLTATGHVLTWAINGNQTVSLTSDTTGEFADVAVGDTIFVPGLSTGDEEGPFSVMNEGFWTVISKDGTNTILQLSRPSNTDFSAYSEAIEVVADTDIIAFSAAGVQAGDSVVISDGFSTSVLTSFIVDRVTPTWFEILTTLQLPVAETAVPGVLGMLFYKESKRFLKIESDQDIVVRLNGDEGSTCRVAPWYAGNASFVGEFIKTGPVWSLEIENVSASEANVLVISAE